MALIPPVTRLTSSIIRILGCNPSPMTLQGTNTYLLGKGERRTLVDTGDLDIPDYIKHLKGVLQEEKATIDTIILTHWHHDHVGGVKDVVKTCTEQGSCQVYKYPRTDANDICPEIPTSIKVQPLNNGQEFMIDGEIFKVIHTPGHTTDHVILLTNSGILFSGDCILGEGTAVFEDLYDYMKSLKNILDLKPKIIYPGHGNIMEEPGDKVQYYINHRNQREKQILDEFIKNPNEHLQAMDLVKSIYKETPEKFWHAAAYNVGHHLKKLAKEGKIDQIKNKENFFVYSQARNSNL